MLGENLLYLSKQDVESINLGMSDIIDAPETGYTHPPGRIYSRHAATTFSRSRWYEVGLRLSHKSEKGFTLYNGLADPQRCRNRNSNFRNGPHVDTLYTATLQNIIIPPIGYEMAGCCFTIFCLHSNGNLAASLSPAMTSLAVCLREVQN